MAALNYSHLTLNLNRVAHFDVTKFICYVEMCYTDDQLLRFDWSVGVASASEFNAF